MPRAKKHAMRTKRRRGYFTPRLYRSFTMRDGTVIPIGINRRGCTSKWSDADDKALGELVAALHRMKNLELADAHQ